MYNNDNFRKMLKLVYALPEDVHFMMHETELSLQANTQEKAKGLRQLFPGTIWRREWVRGSSWWQYTTTYFGILVKIYAVREAPLECTAIMQTKQVEKKIPTEWETVTEEEKVIVGWNCTEPETEEVES